MNARNIIDSRNPKDILKLEIYLTAPMIRRILGCTYVKALSIINQGLEIEKAKKLYIVDQRKKQMRTAKKEIINYDE